MKIFKPRGSGPIADLAAEGGYKQVKLTFSAPNGATSVSVKQRESGALTWVDATTRYAVTALSTEAVVINLEDDTEYEFKLVITGGPHAGDSNIAAAKTFEPYEEISDLTGVGGYREVYLTFSPVTAATLVKVKVWDSTVGAWVDATTDAPITAGATSATVVGLEDDTEYFFYLEVTGGPRHGNSNQVNVRTNPPETPPGPISDLTATDGYRMVTLNFSAPHGATSVTVKQRESGAVLWSDATTLDPVTDRSMEAIVTELEHDTEYEFKLEVIGGPHAGDSNIATVRTFEGPIRDLAGVGGDREVHLTFSPVTGATSVVVKVWDSTAGVWVDATTDAPITDGATSATVIGLEDDTNYNIHLHVTGGRRGGTSNIVLVRTNPRATGPVTPVPLSNLTASGGDRSVTLSFSAPTGATSVTVKQRVQGETSWTDATTNAPITATSTHAVVTGLADNTTYEFYLVVVGGERAGDSNTAVATTNAATGADSIPPTWPGSSELTLSDITRTTVQLTWPAAQDNVAVKGYRIYVDGDQKVDKVSGDFNYSVTDDTYTYTVTGLNPNTTYEFDVKAYDAGNNVSEPGLSATATTLARQSSGGGRNIWLPSDNADMKLLEIRADGQLLTLEPSFDPEVTEYTVTTSARQVELTAVVQHYGAKGEWNGQTLDGTPIRIDLQQGENVIKLVVEAENRTTQTYTLTIVRTVPKSVEKEQGTDEAQTDGAFSDTAGHWAEADIREAVLKGFVRGYPDGTFRPNQPVTRAEFSVMLVEALQLDREASELTFTDLDQIGPWARRSVAIAVQTGIVSGVHRRPFSSEPTDHPRGGGHDDCQSFAVAMESGR